MNQINNLESIEFDPEMSTDNIPEFGLNILSESFISWKSKELFIGKIIMYYIDNKFFQNLIDGCFFYL